MTNRLYIFLSLLLYPLLITSESSCAAEDGVCTNDVIHEAVVRKQPNKCHPRDISPPGGDLYSNGGSAQAYKPNQPEKSEICDASMYEASGYRPAAWPFFQSSSRRPPKITLTIQPWRCSAGSCCEFASSNLLVDIWQTRPDGTYSSLRPGQQDGDCRARQQFRDGSTFTFTTVAPGSTGILGGLGPYGFDLAPYGPPVLHILAVHPDIEPTLLNVPILIQRQTLESAKFRGSDWRGAAWTQNLFEISQYNITLWEAKVAGNSINIHLDVYLREQDGQSKMTLTNKLCRAWVYGLPYSFFVEPISICAPLYA